MNEWISAPQLLSARGLRRDFGDFAAVTRMDLYLSAGEIVALLGPNGAGKSTTMRMLTGLLEPSHGSIFYQDYDLSKEVLEAKRQFGYVADEPMILGVLSGWEYIQFVAGLYGASSEDIRWRAEPLVRRFQLEEAIHKRAISYSHGMKQKLALIAQLAHRPKVLLADEPTVGLDPGSAAEMQDIFREYVAQGNAILLSTHLLDMAQNLATRIVMMAHGRVVAEGTPEELTQNGASLHGVFMRLTGEVGAS